MHLNFSLKILKVERKFKHYLLNIFFDKYYLHFEFIFYLEISQEKNVLKGTVTV